MQSIAYILDGRNIRRILGHMVPATALGVYLASHYEPFVLRGTTFAIPILGMCAALRQGPDEAMATIVALADYRNGTTVHDDDRLTAEA
jgi:hypothetical protein